MGGTVTPQAFGYTGAIVTYVVPQTGLYLIDALGAQGGYLVGVTAASGGGEVEGEFNLLQGQTLEIAVGGAGGPAGVNGYGSGGGGGGSFVVLVNGSVDTVLEVAGGGSFGYLPGGSNAGGGSVGGTGLGGGGSPEDDGAGGGGFYGVGQNGVAVSGDTPGNVFSGNAPTGGGDFATGLAGGAGSDSLINGVPDTGGMGGFGGGGGGGALGEDGTGGGGGYTGGNASSGGSSYIAANAFDPVLTAGVNVAVPASSTPANGEVAITYIPCFARGSRVATLSGLVAVETLRPGDLVMSHRRGINVPVRWVGQRRVDYTCQPRPERLHPIVVTADAFGRGLPLRDLWLSPDHAIYAEDVLIPVRVLVNGQTIRRQPVREITYVHVELDMHDVLLAEGLPVESFLDTGGRGALTAASAPPAAAWFAAAEWEARGCAPLHLVGPTVDRVRARLAAQDALQDALQDAVGVLAA